MGNCFKKKIVETYREKNWKNATLEMESIENYFTEDDEYEKMLSNVGSTGFPFKTKKGRFIKVVMKNKKNTAFKIMMQLKELQKKCNNPTFLLLPIQYVETNHAIHFHYSYCPYDMINYLNTYTITPNKRDEIFQNLLDAVGYMHNQGFVHKDIKLDNIVIHNGKAVLCDLDFASRDNVYSYKGTKDYMPPESVRKCLFDTRKDVKMEIKNKWMDCYALGKTFAKVLSLNKNKDKDIYELWHHWTNTVQTSMRRVIIKEEDFLLKSRWWNIVIWFCKYNEAYVFGNRKEYFWSINKAKNFM